MSKVDNSANPRLPKKQRRRDENPPDPPAALGDSFPSLMECEGEVNTRPTISYKDVVTGPLGSRSPGSSATLDDDDIELLADDIALGVSNGIPTIDFSDRVQQLAIKSMDLTLVVKVLGRRIGYNTLHNRIYSIWKPTHSLKLIDIENDYFLVKFSDRIDYLKVLTEGPWTIFGHYLTVEPWSIDFQPSQSHPHRLMAWIRLPGLPVTLYKRSFIEAIGNQIGSVIKIDFQTDNGCRGRFARMAVSINLQKPLISKIVINGRLQIIEYESLPTVCFKCGFYGHLQDICPTSNSNEDSSLPPAVLPPQSAPVVPISIPDEPFGLLMLVERRKRNSRVPNSMIREAREDYQQRSISNPIFAPLVADSESHPDGVIQAIEDQTDPFMEIPAIPNQSNIVSNSSEIPIQQPAKVNAKGKQSGISKKSTTLTFNPKKSGTAGPTGLKLRHALSLPAMHNSRTAASSSKVLASKPTVALDPVKHKAVHLPAATPPTIPSIAPSASVQDGQEAMLE
ncbi:hypothetical protein GQ457_05G029420 [Hibiscus cannabinus]